MCVCLRASLSVYVVLVSSRCLCGLCERVLVHVSLLVRSFLWCLRWCSACCVWVCRSRAAPGITSGSYPSSACGSTGVCSAGVDDFFFGNTPSASGWVHKCLIEPAARWRGFVLNARSKSAPVRRRLHKTEWAGSSSSLAARYPHKDCTYSASAVICLSTAAVCAAFSGARTRSIS